MGRTAVEGSDILVVTDHHPRFEDIESIRATLIEGARRARPDAEIHESSPPEAAIVEAVRYRHRLVVVAENHSVVGGLGEAVAGVLLRNLVQPAGFQLAGLPDAFLDAGALPTLHDRYGISREALASRIRGWLG